VINEGVVLSGKHGLLQEINGWASVQTMVRQACGRYASTGRFHMYISPAAVIVQSGKVESWSKTAAEAGLHDVPVLENVVREI
jgi:hypothetical protein